MPVTVKAAKAAREKSLYEKASAYFEAIDEALLKGPWPVKFPADGIEHDVAREIQRVYGLAEYGWYVLYSIDMDHIEFRLDHPSRGCGKD